MAKYLLSSLLLIIVALISAIAWVAGTTDGLRWMVGTAQRHLGAGITAGTVEGRLVDRATLKQVTVTLPQQKIELDAITFAWKPSLLLAGTIGIRELALSNLRIHDSSPLQQEPPDLLWPRPPRFAELFDLHISLLRLDKITYRHLDGQPVIVSHIQAGISWQEQRLSLQNLALTTAQGSLSGKLGITFRPPSLETDLDFVPTQPMAEMRHISISTQFLPGKGDEQVAGSFTISGDQQQRQPPRPLHLKGVAGITRHSINLRTVLVTVPDLPGEISADGSLLLTATEPLLAVQLHLSRLNMEKLIKERTELTGTVNIKGRLQEYRGSFDLKNSGNKLQAGKLTGYFQGSDSGITLSSFTGKALGGDVSGKLEAVWSNGVKVSGTIRGRKLDPAIIAPDWNGLVNVDLAGNLAQSKTGRLSGAINAVLLDSTLHGQALTGKADATIKDHNLWLERLQLQGKGFDLNASGELSRKLDFRARVSDLSRLVPHTGGTLSAQGWVRLNNAKPSGAITATGRNLSRNSMRIGSLQVAALLGEGKDYPLRLNAGLSGIVYDNFRISSAAVTADGTALSHRVKLTVKSTEAEAHLAVSGAYANKEWKGTINTASGRDSGGPWSLQAPSRLALGENTLSVSPLLIVTPTGERLELTINELHYTPLAGRIVAKWNRLNLSRANAWLHEPKLTGRSDGAITAELRPGKPFFAGNLSAAGSIAAKEGKITVEESRLRFENGKNGLSGNLELRLKDGGRLAADFASPVAAGSSLPDVGDFRLEARDLNTAVLAPWLPAATTLGGRISGTGKGRLLPGKRFTMAGSATLDGGRFRSVNKEGTMDIHLRNVSANWNWHGETLEGNLALVLAEYGDAKGSFRLPLPAKFPIAVQPDGPIQGTLAGKVREKGMLTALFPELVQESHGDLDFNIGIGGIWKEPKLTGKVALARAGGYILRAGIRLKDVTLSATLENDLVNVESFRINSGSGYLAGKALLRLKGGKLAAYSGSINGRDFQTVSFPELQVVSTPELTFTGTGEKLTVRGEVKLPQLHVNGKQQTGALTPSKDVIVEGRKLPEEKKMPLELDIQVRLLLGDSVLVKAQGIDAQLGGGMELQIQGPNRIRSKGEIKVVKGRYKTYGINLEIVRGNIFYAGGSITQPTLDILALRTTGETKAGVTVTGTLQAPLVKLYSEPAMPDVDILAYMVLGHPLGGSSTEQISLLTQAAGMLLSAGQSASLQEQIKGRLGLSTLELQSAGSKATYMGYKPIEPTALAGKNAAAQSEGLSQTILTVGKYLTPQLYISYGRSIFTGENRFLLRYDIFKKWQIETQTGSESGADLYYKIEFN